MTTTQKSLEIRYYLIGDEYVGKKSICNRFQKLNASETILGKEIKLEATEAQMKAFRRLEENKLKSNEEIKESIIQKLKEKISTNFIKIYTISNLSLEHRFFIPSRASPITYSDGKDIVEELDELEKTYKLKFENTKAEISNFIKQPNFNYFKTNSNEVRHVFIFVYDLSDEESLEKAIVYFEQLNKTFDFFNHDNYHVVFLANKIDIRTNLIKNNKNNNRYNNDLMNNDDINDNNNSRIKNVNFNINNDCANYNNNSNNYNSFNNNNNNNNNEDVINKNTNKLIKEYFNDENYYAPDDNLLIKFLHKYSNHKIHLYEISTKMFFNFEKLYERMFKEIFCHIDPVFQQDYFKERLFNILHLRKTFPKAPKVDIMVINKNNPSPQDYNTDVLFVDNKNERNDAYNSKKRYQYKIFLNKIGPVFKTSRSLTRTDVLLDKSKRKNLAISNSKEEEESKKRRMKLLEEINAQKNGFTLGILPGKNDFFSKRSDIKRSNAENFEKLFALDNISRQFHNTRSMKVHPKLINNYKSPSRDKVENNIKKINKEQEMKNMEYLENLKNKWENIEYLKKNNSLETQKVIVERAEKRKDLKKLVEINKKSREKKIEKLIPQETNYKSSIELNKGFTILGKPTENKIKQGFNHHFYTLRSEFDVIMENQRTDLTFSKANRFGPELRYYDPNKKKFVTTEDQINNDKAEKLNLMNQMMNLRMQKKQEYLNEEALLRQERKNKIEMFKIQNTDTDDLKDKNKRSPGVWSYEPDYYPWGMTNPSYSIGGKLDQGFLGNIGKKKEDGMLGYESHNKIIANSLVDGYVPLPNHNAIKNSPPKYSFPKSSGRFSLPNINNPESNLGPGAFFNNDFVTINKNKEKVLYMSKGARKPLNDSSKASYPGPGQYKIPGFTESVLKKYENKNKQEHGQEQNKNEVNDNSQNISNEDNSYNYSNDINTEQS